MDQNNLPLTLYTETVIDSCHNLVGYIGKCCNMHGHSWKISLWINGTEADKDPVGIMFDFGLVSKIKEKYDHQYLNTIPPFDKLNPTAENISATIYRDLKKEKPNLKFRVRVYETAVGKETYCQVGDDF